ncbi:hypothetical protein MYOV057v1_p0133 [Vibrio phage 184E37.1]|nr:hypothetical protein MYOV057v1_p0133 [Vibrio phage 184E37.1]
MWKWLEDKLGITELREDFRLLKSRQDGLQGSLRYNIEEILEVKNFVKEVTTVSADIQYKHSQGSTIVVTGRYRNNDYVNIFTVEHKDMNYIVDFLRDKERTMSRGYYDTPLHMDMKNWIDRG